MAGRRFRSRHRHAIPGWRRERWWNNREYLLEQNRKWQADNKHKIRAYYESHRAEYRARKIKWRKDNKDRWLAYERAYGAANPEKKQSAWRRFYEKNRRAMVERSKEYCRTHRDEIKRKKWRVVDMLPDWYVKKTLSMIGFDYKKTTWPALIEAKRAQLMLHRLATGRIYKEKQT